MPKGPVKLDGLEHTRIPIHYLGKSFEGLPLTYADTAGPHAALLVYGTCESSGKSFRDGGCTPPLQLRTKACPPDSANVAIYSDDRERAVRAAKALRPLTHLAQLLGNPAVTFERSLC